VVAVVAQITARAVVREDLSIQQLLHLAPQSQSLLEQVELALNQMAPPLQRRRPTVQIVLLQDPLHKLQLAAVTVVQQIFPVQEMVAQVVVVDQPLALVVLELLDKVLLEEQPQSLAMARMLSIWEVVVVQVAQELHQ
jgi:hypothetical protein